MACICLLILADGCNGYFISRMGKAERCEYRWASKECPECGHENDIAARYCEKCKAELVDPNSSPQNMKPHRLK